MLEIAKGVASRRQAMVVAKRFSQFLWLLGRACGTRILYTNRRSFVHECTFCGSRLHAIIHEKVIPKTATFVWK